MDGHGRSLTLMDAHGRWVDAAVTLGGRDGHVGCTLGGRGGHAGWTRRSRWVDAMVTLGGRDGHATFLVTLPNHKNHCKEIFFFRIFNIFLENIKNPCFRVHLSS